jgi:DNA replication protein DnaC
MQSIGGIIDTRGLLGENPDFTVPIDDPEPDLDDMPESFPDRDAPKFRNAMSGMADLMRNRQSDPAIWGSYAERYPEPEPVEPDVISDPFSQSNPLGALSERQSKTLQKRWNTWDFGARYQKGEWERSGMASAKKQVKSWLDNGCGSVVLHGPVGTGKTTLMGMMMACLAATNQFSFVYYSMLDLFEFLHHCDESKHSPVADRYHVIRDEDYLFLDDIGTEYRTDWALSRFHKLVESRYKTGDQFHVISTNLSRGALMAHTGMERAIDRIIEGATWIEVTGKSQRR